MARTYLVDLPKAEGRHLAGVGSAWPATPEARALGALREWLHGICRSGAATIAVSKIVADLSLILDITPAGTQPVRGPLRPDLSRPPGRAEYLGSGTVRLDEAAIAILAELRDGEDFRVTFTDAGPILTVGADHYAVHEEQSSLDPNSTPGPGWPAG